MKVFDEDDDQAHTQQHRQNMSSPSLKSSPQQDFIEQNPSTPDHRSSAKTNFCPKRECFHQVWTAPASIRNEQNESSSKLSQRCLVTPPNSIPAESSKINNFIGRKRQRSFESQNLILPPLLPRFPELDGTVKSNPYRRHFAIHSPIAGIRDTLNLEFITNMKLPMPSEKEEMDKIQKVLPFLDGCLTDAETKTDDLNRRDNYSGIGTKSRSLKMRRRCRKDNSLDIFDPTAFVT
eukprot:jgi/Psemu1/58223/gm1.58223_g